MIDHDPKISPLGELDEESALRTILEGTANETGERFFAARGRKSGAGIKYPRLLGHGIFRNVAGFALLRFGWMVSGYKTMRSI